MGHQTTHAAVSAQRHDTIENIGHIIVRCQVCHERYKVDYAYMDTDGKVLCLPCLERKGS